MTQNQLPVKKVLRKSMPSNVVKLKQNQRQSYLDKKQMDYLKSVQMRSLKASVDSV